MLKRLFVEDARLPDELIIVGPKNMSAICRLTIQFYEVVKGPERLPFLTYKLYNLLTLLIIMQGTGKK